MRAVTAATKRLQLGSSKRGKLNRALSPKKIRVCVLYSSYEGADSPTAAVDDYECSPRFWISEKNKDRYEFVDVALKKADSYACVRELISSGKYDVFYNLCDGAKDEKRAGVDVVLALESLNAAFTGADSRSFEPNKVDMKVLVGNANVSTPNFVLVDDAKDLGKKCRHLRFPVIVKHMSGYASVGITKESRCSTLQELEIQVRKSLKSYNHALVEEFIRGKEGTVLVCADPTKPHGIRVFQPIMYTWLQNADDFAHFESKWSWESTCDFMPKDDPAYASVKDMAANAFKHIMNGQGYGRCDFRIDSNGTVYFLEINANCGMLYNPEVAEGGDFADMMVAEEPNYSHDDFIGNSIAAALQKQEARAPWYCISHDAKGNFSTRSSESVPSGTALFGDPISPVPVLSKALYQLGEDDAKVGCVICRGDGINSVVAIRHSCEPNMYFVHGRTLTFESARAISKGEELTVDYATLRDPNMPAFACACGTASCRSVVFPDSPKPRVSRQASEWQRRSKMLSRRKPSLPGTLYVVAGKSTAPLRKKSASPGRRRLVRDRESVVAAEADVEALEALADIDGSTDDSADLLTGAAQAVTAKDSAAVVVDVLKRKPH